MQRQTTPGFGRVSPEHAATFLGIISILHAEPAAPQFARLLKKELQSDDYVLLAHLFEEISVLMLHHMIPEALVSTPSHLISTGRSSERTSFR